MAAHLRINNPLTWNECEALIAKGRSGCKKLAGNLYLIREGFNYFDLKLHNTIIARIFCNNKIQLNMGNWDSMLTRRRLNEFTNAGLYRHKGVTMIDGKEFINGMIIKSQIKEY